MDPTHSSVSAEELLAHSGFLRRVAEELVGDPHRAADLVQDTWVVALEHPPQPGSVRGWLATVARRLAGNARRGEGRRTARERAAARPEGQDPGELSLERIEIQRTLFELVLELSEVQRTVLYLRYYEGLKPAEIAARLDVPLKTVKSRHTRAVAELRRLLDARAGGERHTWLAALVPLVTWRPAGPLAHGALGRIVGGLVMKNWGIAAALFVLVAAWLGVRGPLLERLGAREGRPVAVQPLETRPAPPTPALAAEAPAARRSPAELAEEAATTGTLELRITWSDGTPAAHVGLELVCMNDPAPREERFRATTGESGAVRVEGLFAGEVRIRAEGRRWQDGVFLEAEVVAGVTRVARGSLAAGTDVEGTVVDSAGAPVPGAELWGGVRRSREPEVHLLGRSGPDGSFRLRALAARSSIGARAAGHRPSPCFQIGELAADASGRRRVVLELAAPGGSVHGVVLDPEGRPLPGAWVCGGARGGHSLTLASGASATAPEPAAVVTADDGTFVLPGDLDPGVQPLYAQARGYPTWCGEIEVAAGRAVEAEIRLERGARVEGRVVDVEGAPIGGVLVRAAEEDRGGWYWYPFSVSEDTSDEDGSFVLDWLAPGERELNASDRRRPEIGRARARITCAAGETRTCELRLDLGLTIAGSVVDADGRPLEGWNVFSETPVFTTWYPRQARTDKRGRFRLYNLGACDHDVLVRAPDLGHPRARVTGVAAGTEDLEIVVADAHTRAGRARGRLVDETGGSLESLSLTLWRVGGNEGQFQEFDPETGAFELEATPGSYELRVARGSRTLATSATFAVREDDLCELGELRIERVGELELVVSGPSELELESLQPALDRAGHSSVDLELADGVFRVPSIAPGIWTLTSGSERWHLPPTVEIEAGERTTLVLEAQATLPLLLEITRADGAPIRELSLEARRPDGALLRRDRRGYSAPHASIDWQLFLPPGPVSIEVRAGRFVGEGDAVLEAPFGSLAISLDEL